MEKSKFSRNTYGNFINGKWQESSSGETFKSLNPTTLESLGFFQSSTKEDVEEATEASLEAYKLWCKVPAPKRAEILLKTARILKERKYELGKLVSIEMGKVLKEGLGDVQEAIDVFEYMAGEGRRLFGYTTPSELPDKFAMTMRIPIGVCGLITPWNFPIAIPAWKISPALICGNTIVFKPASDTPLCAIKLVGILEEAGLPKGVLNLVTGSGNEVGDSIVNHKNIEMISFTGSLAVGKHIAEKSGSLMKKVGLELGGKNEIIIMDDADLDLALDGVVWGAFGTTGQRCTASSRVIVHEKIAQKFEKMLVQKTEKLVLGNPLDKKTDLGPLINEKQLVKVHNYSHVAVQRDGAKILLGGKKFKHSKHPGYFYEPTIFTNVTKDMAIAQEEIFGPCVSIIKVKNLEDAIDVGNSVEYGLSSSIYTRDINKAFKAIKELNTGLTYVNSSTIGSEVHLPFGGTKKTGNGTREAGIEGIHEFSQTKTIYIDYSGKLQKAQGID